MRLGERHELKERLLKLLDKPRVPRSELPHLKLEFTELYDGIVGFRRHAHAAVPRSIEQDLTLLNVEN